MPGRIARGDRDTVLQRQKRMSLMQQKKWFVSYVIKPKGENHVTTHAFIEGEEVEEALEAYMFEIKKSLSLDTEELTLLSVSRV